MRYGFYHFKDCGIYGIYYYYRDCVFKRWINDLLHKANAEIDHERELRSESRCGGETVDETYLDRLAAPNVIFAQIGMVAIFAASIAIGI